MRRNLLTETVQFIKQLEKSTDQIVEVSYGQDYKITWNDFKITAKHHNYENEMRASNSFSVNENLSIIFIDGSYIKRGAIFREHSIFDIEGWQYHNDILHPLDFEEGEG